MQRAAAQRRVRRFRKNRFYENVQLDGAPARNAAGNFGIELRQKKSG
jgi:hypothetical protein